MGGQSIGTQNKPILLDDLMEDNLDLHESIMGIPSDELLKRNKYSWLMFLKMNCEFRPVISKYLKSSMVENTCYKNNINQ